MKGEKRGKLTIYNGLGEFRDSENFCTIETLAKETGYSESHLRSLLRQEKVTGVKVGDIWLAKVSAIMNYKASISNQNSSH